MIAMVIGILFIIFGLWGISHWFHDFLLVLRGFIPISILIGGIISVAAGISSLRNRRNDGKPKQ